MHITGRAGKSNKFDFATQRDATRLDAIRSMWSLTIFNTSLIWRELTRVVALGVNGALYKCRQNKTKESDSLWRNER